MIAPGDAARMLAALEMALHAGVQASDAYGRGNSTRMSIEECAELIVSLQHLARSRVGADDVREEIADVLITVLALAHDLGAQESAGAIERKAWRLMKHLR